MDEDFFQRVYRLVRKIPPGKVATYGQIAAFLTSPGAARSVGYALNALKTGFIDPPVPWQRVINSRGKISLPYGGGFEIQRDMLADEGVVPDENGVYDLNKYLWDGRAADDEHR